MTDNDKKLWSEQRYDKARTKLNTRLEVVLDRGLANLFTKCGWTQQRIAEKEGLNRQGIVQMLIFGRCWCCCELAGRNLSETALLPAPWPWRAPRSPDAIGMRMHVRCQTEKVRGWVERGVGRVVPDGLD